MTDAAGALTRGRVLAIVGAFVAVGVVLAVLADPSLLIGRASGAWHMASPRLSTPWTHDVSPSNALLDYPRPELTRPLWRSLNGVWQFSGASSDEHPPFGQTLDERVLVPYPIESALSGIERHEDRMWYRRTFQVPKSWHVGSGRRLMLNFGAVDYDASVYVNGTKVAAHHGGYTKFSADVTRALNPRGEQELVVGVTDLADKTWQPVGKQRHDPEPGAFYEGASGIWQSVWMEPVSVGGHVRNLRMTPDIDSDILRLTVDAVGAAGARVDVVVESGGKRISTVTGRPGRTIQVPVKHARLWSPNDPFLYTLTVTLARGNAVVDRVGSYFGMREIGTARGPDGKLRITLNHKPTFLMATLDQGYWPDGIYTAPTDAALRFDIAKTKALGFNTIRKHMKVEPDRWYYAADQLGMMVWQDMPAMRIPGTPPHDAEVEFERQLHEVVAQHASFPSIIGWIPINEGWGETSAAVTGRLADEVQAEDPSRLVDADSGMNCCYSHGDSGRGDVIDWHVYTGPAEDTPDANRVAIDGEHGGFGLEVPGHMWFDDGHAYEMLSSSKTLTRAYVENQRKVLDSARRCGISGAVYTQTTDVEHEVNGLYTYDRRVEKLDFAKVRAVNRAVVRDADRSATRKPARDRVGPGAGGLHAYSFDEGRGGTSHDSIGHADATLTNATWGEGIKGGGVSFSGSGEVSAHRSLVETDGSYTVSAWARLDVADDAFQTLVSQDTRSSSAFFLQYSGQDQRWAMSFLGTRALSPTKPQVGRWYHLVGVHDAAAGTLSLYVDGRKVATQRVCNAPASSGDTVIGRGQYDGHKADFVRGEVDDVRLYDRALTDAEIARIPRD